MTKNPLEGAPHSPTDAPNPAAQSEAGELGAAMTQFLRQLHLPVLRAQRFWQQTRDALGDEVVAATTSLLHTERALQQTFALMSSMDRYMRARRAPLNLRPLDVNALWPEVIRAVAPLLTERPVELTHDPLPVVEGDRQALEDILIELVSNALKFTRSRPVAHVHLLVQETDAAHHLGVQDNGVGFNPTLLPRLFQLFSRGHPSSQYEGAGLGLAVVRWRVERVGGRAWGEKAEDQGATFWIAWPKHPTVDDRHPS